MVKENKLVTTINKGDYSMVFVDNVHVCDIPNLKPKMWYNGMSEKELDKLTKAELIKSIIKGELVNGEK